MHAKGTILTTISSTPECVTFVQLTWATFKCTTWYILPKTTGQKNDGYKIHIPATDQNSAYIHFTVTKK